MEHKNESCLCEGKVCSHCQELKCIDFYPFRKDRKGELKVNNQCKSCVNQRKYEWAKANPGKVKTSRKKAETNRPAEQKEKIRLRRIANAKRWNKEHPEQMKLSKKRWNDKNKERSRDYIRRWRKKNPIYDNEYHLNRRLPVDAEKRREHYRKYYKHKGLTHNWDNWQKKYPERRKASLVKSNYLRRARIKQDGGSYTPQEWLSLVEKYDRACLCCGRKEPEIKLTVDHIIPVALNGSNTIENIQPLCHSCNSKKGKKIIDFRDKKA